MKNITTALCLMLLVAACHSPKNAPVDGSENQLPAYAEGITTAAPIVYEVIIRNFDTADTWKTSCLEGLDKALLLNTVFDEIYAGRLTAIDYFTDDTITSDELRQIESESGSLRSDIAKLQFTENWIYDTVNSRMVKTVQDITFGYPKYMDDTAIVGYKPVFKINFD